MTNLLKLAPTLAALIVMAMTLALGVWQIGRGHEKDALASRFDALAKAPPLNIDAQILAFPETLEYHPAIAHGTWAPEHAVFLDNKVNQGRVGFQIIMPLRLSGSDTYLLVNRGWLPASGDRSLLPEPQTATGMVSVKGFLRVSTDRFKELSDTYREGRIWENVTIERFAAWSKFMLQPVVMYQTDPVEDGLLRDWARPDSGSERNFGYALQWFALSALTGFFWLRYVFRRKSPNVV